MESVQSLVSAVTLLTSCVIVSVFVPPEIIVNNDAIDIVPPVYKHPFIEPSIPFIDEKPFEEETFPSYEEEEIVILEPIEIIEEENMTEEYVEPEVIIEELEEEVEEIPPEEVPIEVVEEPIIEIQPPEKSTPISEIIQEYVARGKVVGLKLLTEPQYSHFRVLVDIISIILCIVLFSLCARKREIPNNIIAKQSELIKLNEEIASRSEKDKENRGKLAESLPELQNINSEFKNEVKINEELLNEYNSKAQNIIVEDITQQQQQQQDEVSPSVEEEMKRLESEEEANLLAIKNKNKVNEEQHKVEEEAKLAKQKQMEEEAAKLVKQKQMEEEAEKARLQKLLEEQEAEKKRQEAAKLLLLEEEAEKKRIAEENNRIAKEKEEALKAEINRKEAERQEQIKREQQEKQRQEELKASLAKGIEPETIHIGSKVLVNGSEVGIVRHFGTVNGLEGNYYGVEFDVPVGKNDGCGPLGDRYFVTKKNQGLFVQREKLSLAK